MITVKKSSDAPSVKVRGDSLEDGKFYFNASGEPCVKHYGHLVVFDAYGIASYIMSSGFYKDALFTPAPEGFFLTLTQKG